MLKAFLKPVTLGTLWCLAVTGSYYVYNYPYYKEKVGLFGRFLINFLG